MHTDQSLKLIWWEVMQKFKQDFPNYYQLLKENGYKVTVEDKKARYFGRCYPKQKKLSLNLFLHKNSTKEMIIDTCLHEIAHAIDFCQRGCSDHSRK